MGALLKSEGRHRSRIAQRAIEHALHALGVRAVPVEAVAAGAPGEPRFALEDARRAASGRIVRLRLDQRRVAPAAPREQAHVASEAECLRRLGRSVLIRWTSPMRH